MNEAIDVEKIHFSDTEVENILGRMDPDRKYNVKQLIYYPYYFFEFSINRKSFFHPIGGTAGCTVDGINSLGALVDTSPGIKTKTIIREKRLISKIDSQEAMDIAKKFLYESISFKMKILTMPKLNVTEQNMFYRPYWVAEGRKFSSAQFSLAIDAVTGKYHPL